jgi:hypothetical protein
MKSEEAREIIASNLSKLVELMLTVQKGASVDVFCDPAGKQLSFSKPSGEASLKLCTVIAPDLGCYGLCKEGDFFISDDGSGYAGKMSLDDLTVYVTNYIVSAKNDGAEWGWEFKVDGE